MSPNYNETFSIQFEQTEAVQLLNPLTIQHVGLSSTWHMFDMPCIDHRNGDKTEVTLRPFRDSR